MIEPHEARRYYAGLRDPAHDFDHVLRVTDMAVRIAHAEGADVEVVRAAALLHDVGRGDESGRDHAEIAAGRARLILAHHPAEKVEAVAQAILQHRFRAGPPPDSLEARCLFDADKLDAIGAIGVARVFGYTGVVARRLWDEVAPDYPDRFARGEAQPEEHTAHHEYVVKLVHLRDRMTTQAGRAIAAERHAVIATFFARLAREARGEV